MTLMSIRHKRGMWHTSPVISTQGSVRRTVAAYRAAGYDVTIRDQGRVVMRHEDDASSRHPRRVVIEYMPRATRRGA